MHLLATYRYLYSRQIEEFIFEGSPLTSRSKRVITWRILGRLMKRGLIAMTPRQLGGAGGGSTEPGYFLTTPGLRLAASLCPGLPSKRPARRGTFLLGHSGMVAETSLAFRRFARSSSGHEVVNWECDWQVAMRLGKSRVVPDARLTYAMPKLILEAFVEADTGTEGTGFFRAEDRPLRPALPERDLAKLPRRLAARSHHHHE